MQDSDRSDAPNDPATPPAILYLAVPCPRCSVDGQTQWIREPYHDSRPPNFPADLKVALECESCGRVFRTPARRLWVIDSDGNVVYPGFAWAKAKKLTRTWVIEKNGELYHISLEGDSSRPFILATPGQLKRALAARGITEGGFEEVSRQLRSTGRAEIDVTRAAHSK